MAGFGSDKPAPIPYKYNSTTHDVSCWGSLAVPPNIKHIESMTPAAELVGWQLADVAYPPRFATLEAAQKAMKGDYSGIEVPFKPVQVLGKTEAMLREEYKNAPYEMRIFRK